MGGPKNGRFLSTESKKIDEPFKVEEAETVNVPPPPSEKLLVLGGNGFVGSHICREALNRGLAVASLSRSGGSSLHDSWAKNVTWHKGNLLSSDSWKEALDGVTSVISCIGGFGSNSYMYKINGTANINAIRAAADKGVKRFVYISAADFGFANYLLKGYYEGKRAAETELLTKFPYGGVILRPGFIHGTRTVGSMKLPLGNPFFFFQNSLQIPDELVEHYLAKSGFQCPDVRLIRLVAVATQKFVAEVANDALQYGTKYFLTFLPLHCKARQAAVVKDKREKQQKDKRLILTMDDLSKSLREYGVNVKQQEYFADSPSTGMDPATRDE
ncbi:hypothetical protein GOBAR_DD36450 [Gossypium barbadense]|nr:hypothetical protein GOBAR_DD36450 [Gossypium barbadense]